MSYGPTRTPGVRTVGVVAWSVAARLDSERIVKYGRMGRGETIEEAALQGIRCQERLDFTTQRLIVAGLSDQQGVALLDRPLHSRLEQRLHARP